MKLKKDPVKNYDYVFEFAFDMSVVNFCRQIKEEYSREEFTFDFEAKRWRFNNLEIVDNILLKYPKTLVMSNMYDDVIDFEKKKKLEKAMSADYFKNGMKDISTVKGLRGYQLDALKSVIDAIKNDLEGNHLLVLPTAAGKSLLVSGIAHVIDKPILILQPSKEILQQNYEKLLKYVDRKEIGIYSASMNEKTIRMFTFATIQSIYKKADFFKHFDILILDECFIAGTKIDNKNIEDIKTGDYVDSYNHQKKIIEKKKVLSVSKRWYEENLTDLNNGLIISTYNHPVFAEGIGYVPAYKLNKGDKLYVKNNLPTVQNRNEERNVSASSSIKKICKMERYYSSFSKEWSSFLQSTLRSIILCEKSFRKDEKKQSNDGRDNSFKDVENSQKNRTQTNYSRWKWKRNDHSTKNVIGKSWRWLVSRINCYHWKWLFATSLQNRFRKSIKKDSDRSRWCFSLFSNISKKRQEKRQSISIERVESIQSHKQGHKEGREKGCWVYNLEIEDNNNYFANGVLVHNCHFLNPSNLTGMFTSFINEINELRNDLMRRPPVKVIGLTATPYRMTTSYKYDEVEDLISGMKRKELIAYTTIKLINRIKGRFWKNLLYNINVQELIDLGFLCPLEYIDKSLVEHAEIPLNKSESDFDLVKYEKIISKKQSKIIKTISYAEAVSKSVLVFCVSVKQAEDLCTITKGSAVVTAKTKLEERDAVIEKFKNGEIKTVFNMGIFTIGFDHPALDCIVLLRPTRSIGLYYQILGRGVRIFPGKKSCKVIDMTSTVKNIGRVETIKLVKEKNWELYSECGSWHNRELYRFKLG